MGCTNMGNVRRARRNRWFTRSGLLWGAILSVLFVWPVPMAGIWLAPTRGRLSSSGFLQESPTGAWWLSLFERWDLSG